MVTRYKVMISSSVKSIKRSIIRLAAQVSSTLVALGKLSPNYRESLLFLMDMSMFTIQCRLSASEETRRYFWELMEKYTLLVNELLEKMAQHPQFQEWQKKGAISGDTVRGILAPFKKNPHYVGLPGRFYTSAELMSCYTYKSWLALQKERQLRAVGKKRWLEAIESEFELIATTNFNPEEVRLKAHEI